MARLKVNFTKLFLEALIILVIGGFLSLVLGGFIAGFAASGPILEGAIGIGLAVVTLMLYKASNIGQGRLINVFILFGIAAGMSQIIASLIPQASTFLLGLGGTLTPVSLVTLVFYASLADWIGDQIPGL